MSVTDPSPDLGWRGRERASLERRGTPELALCLAVVHHVCITGNVPVREFLDWLRSLGTALVIEFPDRDDPMVAAAPERQARRREPRLRARGLRAGARGALRRSSAASRSRTRGRSTRPTRWRERRGGALDRVRARRAPPRSRCGRSRSPSRCSGCSAATRSSSSRAGARARDILVLAFGYTLVPPLLGAALVWALGRVRPALGWAAMLVLVALLVRPPAAARGRCARRSGLALAVAPVARRARRRAVRAGGGGAHVPDRALAGAARRPVPVPRRLAGARAAAARRRERGGGGPGPLGDADRARRARRAAGDDARPTSAGGSTPSCSRTSRGWRRRDVVPPRDDRRRPHHRGGARPS